MQLLTLTWLKESGLPLITPLDLRVDRRVGCCDSQSIGELYVHRIHSSDSSRLLLSSHRTANLADHDETRYEKQEVGLHGCECQCYVQIWWW